jgi:hypothetical protein
LNNYFTDVDIQRFIDARQKQGLKAAVELLQKCYYWRHTELLGKKNGLTPHNILAATKHENISNHPLKHLLPHALRGEDREGCPIYWERAGLICKNFAKIKKELDVDDLLQNHIRFFFKIHTIVF